MKRKRIGIVTTWLERGATYVSRQYADILTEQGAEIYIYARGGERYATEQSVDRVTFAPRYNRDKSNWVFFPKRHFRKWINENNLDIVFFNEQKWLEPIQWCHDWGVVNGAYVDYYTETLVPILGLHDFLICNTKRHFSAFKWHPAAYYIPWGTNTEIFIPSEKRDQDRHKFVFFHSAGMNPHRKGTDILINASMILAENSTPDSFLVIIHSQVLLENIFPELIEAIRILQEKKILEIIEDTVGPPGLYHLGDAYIYPSRLDGIGLSLPEAISSGLIPVSPDFPPMIEFYDHSFGRAVKIDKIWSRADGYYWPQNEVSITELANIMKELLENKSLTTELKKKAREYALEYLDWKKNAVDLLHIFEEATFRNDAIKERGYFLAKEYNRKRRVGLRKIFAIFGQ